jgi:hypothetical protein
VAFPTFCSRLSARLDLAIVRGLLRVSEMYIQINIGVNGGISFSEVLQCVCVCVCESKNWCADVV